MILKTIKEIGNVLKTSTALEAMTPPPFIFPLT
jgi:hypothetical protein